MNLTIKMFEDFLDKQPDDKEFDMNEPCSCAIAECLSQEYQNDISVAIDYWGYMVYGGQTIWYLIPEILQKLQNNIIDDELDEDGQLIKTVKELKNLLKELKIEC